MQTYIIRRLLLVIPTAFFISLIVFFLFRLVPGDIVDAIMFAMEEQGELDPVDEIILQRQFGLDASVIEQYGRFLGVTKQKDGIYAGLLQGDLGYSWITRQPVTEMIKKKIPITLELGIFALIIAQLIALPIGVVSALRQNTWADYLGRSFAILAISVPSFWIATVVIVYPSIWWGYVPAIRWVGFTDNPLKNLNNMIVPVLVTGLLMSGGNMRMTRTMMLEVLRRDFIRTAWSKGLRERVVVYRHALKNAMIPVITIIGMQVPILIGGSVIIEQIFSLPGMGYMMVMALNARDYPVVNGVMLVFAFGIVVINLLVDLTYGILDPKIKYE